MGPPSALRITTSELLTPQGELWLSDPRAYLNRTASRRTPEGIRDPPPIGRQHEMEILVVDRRSHRDAGDALGDIFDIDIQPPVTGVLLAFALARELEHLLLGYEAEHCSVLSRRRPLDQVIVNGSVHPADIC